jgi:hypothetical protein
VAAAALVVDVRILQRTALGQVAGLMGAVKFAHWVRPWSAIAGLRA